MAPPTMPELLDLLTETLSPMTEEDASKYLAPTAAYLRTLAAQVSPRPDPTLNQVSVSEHPRLLFWFMHGRTKLSAMDEFTMRNLSASSSATPRHGGGKSGAKRPAQPSWHDRRGN